MKRNTTIQKQVRGFTLIELLIVIGILAILATVTLLVLNPAQMFAQARDSQRISDLNTIKSSIALYLSTVTTPYLDDTSGTSCISSFWGTQATSTTAGVPLFGANTAHIVWNGADATTTVGITGWVPVKLSDTAGGSPISSLPLDPANVSTNNDNNGTAYTTAYYYACSTTQMTFKLVGNMESSRYAKGGTDDKESTDGGLNPYFYETGTNLGASL